MARYDHGGGCACGLKRECDCNGSGRVPNLVPLEIQDRGLFAMAAAAPELLAALREAQYFFDDDFPNGPDGPCIATDRYRNAYKTIIAAIAKATGQESASQCAAANQSTPRTHEVKSWPWFFTAIKAGAKVHDLRKMDRDYQIGDTLRLREFDPVKGVYTGDEVTAEITFITNEQFPCAYSSHALARGYAILSLKVK